MIEQQLLEDAKQMILTQNMERIRQITEGVIDAGEDPLELLDKALIPGIAEVGKFV